MAESTSNLVLDPNFESDLYWDCYGFDSEYNYVSCADGSTFTWLSSQNFAIAGQTIHLSGQYSSFAFEFDIVCPPEGDVFYTAFAHFKDAGDQVLEAILVDAASCSDHNVSRVTLAYKTTIQNKLRFAVYAIIEFISEGGPLKLTNIRLFGISNSGNCTPCREGSFSALPGKWKMPEKC